MIVAAFVVGIVAVVAVAMAWREQQARETRRENPRWIDGRAERLRTQEKEGSE